MEKVNDFFNFKTMITMLLLKYLYFIFVILSVISGILMIVDGNLAGGIFGALGVNILLRLVFEGIILAFSIQDLLVSIDKKVGK